LYQNMLPTYENLNAGIIAYREVERKEADI
jgi:hypothetical protein